jgi:hypothetical protein
MVERSPSGPVEGLRRFLADLRSGGERRSGSERRKSDRRATALPVDVERRAGSDRRAERERRTPRERRRPAAGQFPVEEMQLIRQMVLRPDISAACPLCGGYLLLGPTDVREGVRMQEVHCTGCRRSALLAGV